MADTMATTTVSYSSFSPQSPVPPSSSLSSGTLTPPSATINKHKFLITMGPCTWQVKIGVFQTQCPCPSGSSISHPNESMDQAECRDCKHPMVYHRDYHTPDSPMSSFPPALVSQPVPLPSYTVLRNKLVDELIARVQYFHIIRINGTPASGKTTIMNLMVNKLLRCDPKTPVYMLSGWEKEEVRGVNGWVAYLEKQTGINGRQLLGHRGYLFLDEAQQSYWDDQLWADLFKSVGLGIQLHITLFMSYGSPTRGFIGFEQKEHQKTPMTFSVDQQVSLRSHESHMLRWKPVGLLLDEGEANEVVERFVPAIIANSESILTEDLKRGFFQSSNGHAGLIISLMRILEGVPAVYHLVRNRQPIHWSTISKVFFDDPMKFFQTLGNLPFSRGLPPLEMMQKPCYASVFKEAITCEGIYQSSFQNKSKEMIEALKAIWANGWLHAEKSGDDAKFVFASQIHRWYCQTLFSQKGPDNELNYENPLQLALDVIKRFQPRQLSDAPRSLAANSPPLEDQYQKEFYRCLFPLLDGHVIVSPEFVIKTGSKGGTIDFLIAQKKWGLELLRDRDRLVQHMQRFERGGQYFTMIEHEKMERYIVLDFTDTPPQKPLPEYRNKLYHVVFSENYRKVKVVHASDLKEVGSFVLMESANFIL